MTELATVLASAVLTRQQVDDRLTRAPSKNLDTTRWQAARAALVGLVTAMEPRDEAAAVAFHSHLCDFLRRSSWTAGADVEWQALLTSDAVDGHRDQQIRGGKGNSLISAHRSTLNRARRTRRGGSGRAGFTVTELTELTSTRLARLSLDALALTSAPVWLAAAALAPHAPLTSDRLDGAMTRLAACGEIRGAGTLLDVHLLRLHAAAALSLEEAPMADTTPVRSRRTSRAALKRAATAELDAIAARTLLLDPDHPLTPSALPLPELVVKKIVDWQPAKHNKISMEQFAPVRPLLVRLVLASAPQTPQKAAATSPRRPCRTAARLLSCASPTPSVRARWSSSRSTSRCCAKPSTCTAGHASARTVRCSERPDRKNITGPVKARAQTGTGQALDLDVGRMRKHWLVAIMTAHVPLDVLLACAGLTSTRALTDLLPFLAPPDPAQVHQIVREATDRMLTSPAAPSDTTETATASGPAAASAPDSRRGEPDTGEATPPPHSDKARLDTATAQPADGLCATPGGDAADGRQPTGLPARGGPPPNAPARRTGHSLNRSARHAVAAIAAAGAPGTDRPAATRSPR